MDENTAKEFIQIKVVSIDKKSKHYQNVNMDIEILLGALEINFKPEVLSQLMKFLASDQPAKKQPEPEKKKIEDSPSKESPQKASNIEQENSVGRKSLMNNSIIVDDITLIRVKI